MVRRPGYEELLKSERDDLDRRGFRIFGGHRRNTFVMARSRLEEHFDSAAFVHRLVSFGDFRERQR